jgi:hypothetical protein
MERITLQIQRFAPQNNNILLNRHSIQASKVLDNQQKP